MGPWPQVTITDGPIIGVVSPPLQGLQLLGRQILRMVRPLRFRPQFSGGKC